MSHLISKPGFATIFTIPTGMLNHLGNETRADHTEQMYRLSFPLVVRIWHKLVFWREIKTPAHLWHCWDSSKVKSLHLGPAMSPPEFLAPREPGGTNDWCLTSPQLPDLYSYYRRNNTIFYSHLMAFSTIKPYILVSIGRALF